jgi:uncharacterized protein YceK
MYRFVFIIVVALMVACSSNSSKTAISQNIAYDSINGPVMRFYADTMHLGVLKQGDKVNCEFRFKNEGKSNLLIMSVSAGCGCTNTEWETKPIKPGEESKIKIIFNSAHKIGRQVKSVYVKSNAQKDDKVLNFTCEVVSPNKSQK